ncbi:YrhB domain-containing protein [Kitasatospora sp. NPDC093806]|uniref:YrhB domain-containing protein n=1 Tax=Kitasatospora sp. NPDC093806 TaxID=3155075 RepID=UPI003432DA64
MISKECAVGLVESLLAREWLTWAGPVPELAVYRVEEHAIGWLVFWNSAEYARTRDLRDNLVGSGPYLVDRHDGSIHHVPATAMAGDWELLYLRQVRGGTASDPLVIALQKILRSSGTTAAMHYLRRQAPLLGLQDVKVFVSAVSGGVRPPDELVSLTWKRDACSRPDIETLTGPVTDQ